VDHQLISAQLHFAILIQEGWMISQDFLSQLII
jgi:hypothetical protein